jgi:hypothetical protein
MPRLVLDLPAAKMRALARHARVLDCDTEQLAIVAVEELLAALATPPRRAKARRRATRRQQRTDISRPRARRVPVAEAAAPPVTKPVVAPTSEVSTAPATRTYQPKRCPGCGREFVPTGPRSITCDRCKAEFAACPSLNNADYPNRPGVGLS